MRLPFAHGLSQPNAERQAASGKRQAASGKRRTSIPGMNALRQELDRLYGLTPHLSGEPDAQGSDARHATGAPGSRAAVLAVTLPVGWEALSSVWRGVQSDLELPAPAIAVSGHDALQLWFGFASPTASREQTRFLRGLCQRYLSDVAPSQVQCYTEANGLPPAPCVEVAPQRWSAFVFHDLAAVFAETPWLDLPPSDEGQAAILRALKPMPPAAVEAASTRLGVDEDAFPPPLLATAPAASAAAANTAAAEAGPVHFLRGVMNDDTVALALRIEAAKILLAHAACP